MEGIIGSNIYNNLFGFTQWIPDADIRAYNDNEMHYNNIENNSWFGICNFSSETNPYDTLNWWGHASAPSDLGPGTGDAVSDNVEFCPWALDNAFTNFITLTLSPLPQPKGFDVYLEVTLNDSTSGVSIHFIINGSTHTGDTDGNGIAEINAGPLGVGVYNISASVMSMTECLHAEALLAAYDPTAGFVTDGGWIYSEAGAYVPDPSAEGKASFGFVLKYKKGQSTPNGNTEF